MLKFTLKYLIFAPTCFGPLGPSSGSLHRAGIFVALTKFCSLGVNNFYCTVHFDNVIKIHCKLPEDRPSGPKHVGANIRYFNVNFNILYG